MVYVFGFADYLRCWGTNRYIILYEYAYIHCTTLLVRVAIITINYPVLHCCIRCQYIPAHYLKQACTWHTYWYCVICWQLDKDRDTEWDWVQASKDIEDSLTRSCSSIWLLPSPKFYEISPAVCVVSSVDGLPPSRPGFEGRRWRSTSLKVNLAAQVSGSGQFGQRLLSQCSS